MTKDDGEAEDVTGLFRKFGGDAKAYREFEPAPEPEAARQVAWALVPGGKPAVEGTEPASVAPAPAVSAPVVAPAPAVPAPKAVMPAPAPAVFARNVAAVAVPFPASSKPAAVAVPAPVAASVTAPVAATFAADSHAPSAAAPRPLDLLFARLAGTTGQAAPSQGPLSRWRRPS